ncbi:glucose-1-phosphate adenylyltransferase large subunit 1, chloroplastic/amyloplastic-like isoform X2 [Panicum virgatum]|uniref:Glucose-1-phosphate adenylyltransferase n=1 Tax=Panicum virgatum TaxID=38727 RepID=A0A8T0NB91_PANVG|nr:glucose-1-phosphate adenylyltransferase large subunit 1, chloroplastic/amyloplastic-like isoform X2 [Panicum virgatum]KAG2546108.1 hypothetical protein PVAP13_9KG029098 [Panicum virgatum]
MPHRSAGRRRGFVGGGFFCVVSSPLRPYLLPLSTVPRRALLESFKTHGELGGATTAASPPAIAEEGSARDGGSDLGRRGPAASRRRSAMMNLRVATAAPSAAGARVLGGGVARVPPRPWALRGRRRLSVRMSVATTEAAAAAVGASEDEALEARNSKTVVAVILGGGAGTRLFPLTKRRAKPAVPIGGAYRLIDVPMSNCINSGINKVYILTQFNSASLNRHLSRAYDFSNGVAYGDGFVEVLAATQRPGTEGKRWFQGTADAVRQFDWLFDDARAKDIEDVLILSGDHLYRMDYMDFVQSHRQRGAGISICCLPIDGSRASDFGLMKIDDTGRIVSFSEKPKGDDLKAMQVDTTVLGLSKEEAEQKPYIASMGVYIFKKDILLNLLRWRFPTANDFGSEIIPASAKEINVKAYLFNDYWEDIGTIKSFFEANLALAEQPPRFSFYDDDKPMYTSRRNLPPSMVNNSKITDSIISHGCFLDDCRIEHSVVGVRSRIGSNVYLKDTVMLGADYYETDPERGQLLAEGKVPIGIGENTTIQKCIIDKNARIGKNVTISNAEGVEEADRTSEGFYIRSGITVVLKNSIIADGLVI